MDNPYSVKASDLNSGQTKSQPLPDDHIRAIWFGDGKLHHAHTRYKNVQTVHRDIWSWRNWEPEVLWIYHMRMKIWMSSTRYGIKNEILFDVLASSVPKDIELYNALLGD